MISALTNLLTLAGKNNVKIEDGFRLREVGLTRMTRGRDLDPVPELKTAVCEAYVDLGRDQFGEALSKVSVVKVT